MNESTLKLRNGLVIPRLSIGTWGLNASEAKEAVKKALSNGIKYIDTAQEYQNENAVANAIRESGIDKKSVLISTKLTPREVKDYETAVEGINKSAIIFSGIGIDIMFIHAEDNWDNAGNEVGHDNIGIVKALLEAKEEGIIKAYGVSNFSVKELQKIKDSGLELPEIVQLPHSIGTRRQDVINFCIENNIQMQSYSPFKSSSKFTNDDVINEIANKYGKKVPEVYLSYALQTTGSVVFRSLNEEHIKNNISLIPFLSDEDINTLNKIKRKNDWRYEGVETVIEDDIRPDSEIVDYVIDNETLLGEKKELDVTQSDEVIINDELSDNISENNNSILPEQNKDYTIVDDVSLQNKEIENNNEDEKKLEGLKETDAKAYENMKKLRASNKREIENLINSVNRINIYNVNYISNNQSYSTARNNLTDNLRLRIASTINNQARTLLRLNDAERYYFYKLILEEPLTGRYSTLEKKLYENYFIKNPSIETLISSYEETLKKINPIKTKEEEIKEENMIPEDTSEKKEEAKENDEKDSNIVVTESGVSYDDNFIYYETEEDKKDNNGLSI